MHTSRPVNFLFQQEINIIKFRIIYDEKIKNQHAYLELKKFRMFKNSSKLCQ